MNSGLSENDSLSRWLSWQEGAHSKTWDLGLQRVGEVWQRMGAPKLAEHVVVVAGTNGKGSCVRWLEALCMAHGVSVASFTSPHLIDYRERIRFDAQWVAEKRLVSAFAQIDQARGEISLSYFEWAALAAFYLMAQDFPQVAVLEVGLGGRLDAVNLIDAEAAIFTTIGLDHMQWLGEGVAEIAREKAGVMRAGQRVVCADGNPEKALLECARELGVRPWVLGSEFQVNAQEAEFEVVFSQQTFSQLPLPKWLWGAHQLGHFAACLVVLADFFPLKREALIQALVHTKHTGRLMSVAFGRRDWVLDVAHNRDSAVVLAQFLAQKAVGRSVVVLCGMLADKDAVAVFEALKAQVQRWYLVSLKTARGGDKQWLFEQALAAGVSTQACEMAEDVAQGIEMMLNHEKTQGVLYVVMGSFVTVAQALLLMQAEREI